MISRHIALARGVNVGGANKLPMAALRGFFETAGARRVETIIQSGNVVFDAEPNDAPAMIDAARDAIERNFGFVTRWVTRSAPSWRDLMTANQMI